MKKSLSLLLFLTFQISSTFSQTPEFEWAHAHGGPQSDQGRAVVTDQFNNIYLAGTFQGTMDFDPGPGVTNLFSGGGANVFVQKLNPNGTLIWAKVFPLGSSNVVTSMAIDQADNLILGGDFVGTTVFPTPDSTSTISSPTQRDLFIVKMNAAGDFLWARSFGSPTEASVFDTDQLTDVTVDATGNIYSTGHFYQTADFNPGAGIANLSASGAMDIFVQKLSPAGDYVWAKRIGSSGFDEGTSLTVHENTLFVTGWFQENVDFDPSNTSHVLSSQGSSDIFLLSLTTDGVFNWAKPFGSVYTDKGVGVTTDHNGAIYLTGLFGADIDLDPGPGTTIFTASGTNFFILKLTDSAEYTWAKTFTGTGSRYSSTIAFHPGNGILVSGLLNGTTDFDPGNGVSNLTGQDDIFLVYLDEHGNYVWAGSYGNTVNLHNDLVRDITTDNLGNIYSTGWFIETVDFDCGTGVAERSSAGNEDIYLLKLHAEILSVNTHSLNDLKLFPNPSSGLVSISAENMSNCHIAICNAVGTIVWEKDLSTSDTELDLRSLAAGSYIVQLSNGQTALYQTLVKTN